MYPPQIHPPNENTDLALAELQGALLLADLEELHHALLVGGLTSDLLDDVADKPHATGTALQLKTKQKMQGQHMLESCT